MKKATSCSYCPSQFSQINAQTDQQKAEALVRKMTLEEKVGQMTQVTFAVIAKGGWGDTEGIIDPAALKTAVPDKHVGSILNVNAHALYCREMA